MVATQKGHAIFNLAASFQTEEAGFEHQDRMPEVPSPESLPTEQQLAAARDLPPGIRELATAERPFEMRPVPPVYNPLQPTPLPPVRLVWLRTVDRLADDPALHRYLLAYASDHSFIMTALQPHAVSWVTPGMQVASLDHVMWFHQPFRVDEWLLHAIDGPAAHGARGLVRGKVFTRDGRLVASTAQEGLIRRRK